MDVRAARHHGNRTAARQEAVRPCASIVRIVQILEPRGERVLLRSRRRSPHLEKS